MSLLYHTAFGLSIALKAMIKQGKTEQMGEAGGGERAEKERTEKRILSEQFTEQSFYGKMGVIGGNMKKRLRRTKLMGLDDYQTAALKYDTFSGYQDGLMKYSKDGIMLATENGLIEKVLGLPGEAGEAADKFKKIIRDKNGVISKMSRDEIVKELGDVLWYVAMIAEYLEVPLSEVAGMNIAKLEDRYKRNKLHGQGDNR